MKKDKQITLMEKNINPLVAEARAIKVQNQETLKLSVEMLSRANQTLDKVTEEREKLTKPLNETLREIRLRYSAIEKPLKEVIEHLRNDQSRFVTWQRQQQLKEEARIAERAKAGKLSLEGAVKKMEQVKKTEDTIMSESGMVKFREIQVVRVNNVDKIPREFLTPDYEAIEAALKAGQKVDGCELTITMRPYNSR